MRRLFLSLLPVLLTLSCSAESLAPPGELESAVTTYCPPIPPTYPTIEVTRVTPTTLMAGAVVTFEGHDFDKLPPNTVAWFFAQGNSFTATSRLLVLDSTRARAIVPSDPLVAGQGAANLYYTQCVDCTGQGGGPNSCAGIWVNPRSVQNVTFTHPTPRPLPVSNLHAVAVSESEIQLTWSDNSLNEDFFEILQGPDPASTTQSLGRVSRNQRSEPIDHLDANTTYCYEVRAVNGSGFEPMPPEAKACAHTLPKFEALGTIEVRNVTNVLDTLCPARLTAVPLFAFEDTNGDGFVQQLGKDALFNPAPYWLQPDVLAEPPWRIFIANGYEPGANLLIYAKFESCGPGDPQGVGIHARWDGGQDVRPMKIVVGNAFERTGTQGERFGAVMLSYEFNQALHYDSTTGRVAGAIDGTASFHLDDPPIDYSTHISVDLGRGVPISHE